MELIGKVTSTKMEKTAVVIVERVVVHPLYKKRTKKTKKYKAHDDIGVKIGDRVRLQSMSPISKDKYFKVMEVLK